MIIKSLLGSLLVAFFFHFTSQCCVKLKKKKTLEQPFFWKWNGGTALQKVVTFSKDNSILLKNLKKKNGSDKRCRALKNENFGFLFFSQKKNKVALENSCWDEYFSLGKLGVNYSEPKIELVYCRDFVDAEFDFNNHLSIWPKLAFWWV